MRFNSVLLSCLFIASAYPAAAKPLIGGPKTVPLGADGLLHEQVVQTKMGFGGYVSGAKQVVVPIIAIAFESSAKAFSKHNAGDATVTRSLETRLVVDPATFQAICAEVQGIVEKDLAASGFEVLPKDTVDQDARWIGIAKNGKVGEEIGDNFMSGFAGNGEFSRWFTAENRPLFGTGATGALSELSPLIHIAREKKITLLAYRFKVQYTSIDSKNNPLFSSMSGKNVLHMLGADLTVFSPSHTLGGVIILKADVTAGAEYIEKTDGDKGHYVINANPEQYKAGSLLLIKAVSRQFAEVLRKSQ